jgi:hypothetical protein
MKQAAALISSLLFLFFSQFWFKTRQQIDLLQKNNGQAKKKFP